MKKLMLFFIAIAITSCVSKSIYEDLDNKYNRLKNQNLNLVGENDQLFTTTKDLKKENKNLKLSIDSLATTKTILQNDVDVLAAKKKQLETSYQELSASSSEQLNNKAKEIFELSRQLNQKETTLIAEQTRLEKLKNKLTARAERVAQLENLIAVKEEKMQNLKAAVSNALQNFEGKGLTVHRKNGKVYVSMENKLLFSSGSWNVGSQGEKAVVELANVLKDNNDIEVLIEGHTDNVPYRSNNSIIDNWDLSTKRATAIVRILLNNRVNPKNITAAGKGEYVPLATNNTAQGKAKNRRIEVILTPNLDAINNLLVE